MHLQSANQDSVEIQFAWRVVDLEHLVVVTENQFEGFGMLFLSELLLHDLWLIGPEVESDGRFSGIVDGSHRRHETLDR